MSRNKQFVKSEAERRRRHFSESFKRQKVQEIEPFFINSVIQFLSVTFI